MAGSSLQPKLIMYDSGGKPVNTQEERVKPEPKPEPIPVLEWTKLCVVQDTHAEVAARSMANSALQMVQAAYHPSIQELKIQVERHNGQVLVVAEETMKSRPS